MRQQQINHFLWLVIAEHIHHKAIPTVRPRGLFDRERYLDGKWRSHGVKRQHPNRVSRGFCTTNFLAERSETYPSASTASITFYRFQAVVVRAR